MIPSTMLAMVLEAPGTPLQLREVPVPVPGDNQVLIRIIACGVCRTDLHIMDGDLRSPKLPLIPGHEIVGEIVASGRDAGHFKAGDLAGVPWLAFTCGQCRYCRKGQENLCENALFTGYTVNGGYAEYVTAHAQYCFRIPPVYAAPEGAPLLCAGLIGYRSWRMIDPMAQYIGLYGFGAAAHILTQIARYAHKQIYAFTRKDDIGGQEFSRQLGAIWAGSSDQQPPVKLDAAIIFAPDGRLVPAALLSLDKGGQLVCAGIHMSYIPSFPYQLLWEERSVRSVANLTREDGELFFDIAAKATIQTTIERFKLSQANEALERLRSGHIKGAAVLVPDAQYQML